MADMVQKNVLDSFEIKDVLKLAGVEERSRTADPQNHNLNTNNIHSPDYMPFTIQ
jgi:hypothetical protein